MRDRRPFVLRLASRFFYLCFRLAPGRFRERFGPESEDAFHHLVADTLERRGPKAAITTAAAACGDVARVGMVERASSVRAALTTGIRTDLVHAARIYRREPILAGAIAGTLAIVSGPTLAIVATLYHAVFAPLPYPDAGRLVVVGMRSERGLHRYLSAAAVSDYRNVSAFSMVGGIFPYSPTVVIDAGPERLRSYRATAGFLSGLGVPFAAGRDIRLREPEVVVTRAFAHSRFGSDSAALDRRILVNRETMAIVGVLAYAPPLPGSPGVDLFIPHAMADRPPAGRRGGIGQAIVIARLAAGTEASVALEQVKAVTARVRAQFPNEEGTPELESLRESISGPLRLALLVLCAAVGVVFLIAITSLTTLVLSRAAARAPDIGVRLSLGASRWRLLRAWLADGVVLAVPGVAAGVWVGDLLLGYARASLPPGIVPVPDANVLGTSVAAALVLAGASTLLFTLTPLMAGLLRVAPIALRQQGTGLTALRGVGGPSILIAGQVALSFMLVASAVWLSNSLSRLLARPLGIDTTNIVIVDSKTVQPREVQIELARQMLVRLGQLVPDAVDQVAVTTSLPGFSVTKFVPNRIRADQPVFEERERPELSPFAVSIDYFKVLRIPLLEGRYFTPEDDVVPGPAVIVSRSFAARWFPDGALGRFVAFSKSDLREIVGIVEDVHGGNLMQDSAPQFYVPLGDSFLGSPSTYLLRTRRSPASIRSEISSAIRDLDRTASVRVLAAEEAMEIPLTLRIISKHLAIALSTVALLLAVLNVYALAAFAVVRRKREIGIRVALGAAAADAVALVMRRGLAWTGAGIVLGGGLTMFVAAPLLERQFYETRAGDPWLLAVSVGIVAGAAIVASWLPARRAARIDPAITLRAE